MKMLWLSLLTLVTPVTALPLRTQDLPTRWSHAGPSEADREFAEVFTHIYMKNSQLDLQVSVLGECGFIYF